jgi:hypothetical protein
MANSERQLSFERRAEKPLPIRADKAASTKAIRLVSSKSIRTQSGCHINQRMQITVPQISGNP